ncbi:MAG: branched-chain amino acid transaminase [Deltaproteobacteria bacterium]|nr:MAG: branched-chain amino acid transaminase [Deltaproteobacteria bacterium]
MIEKTKKIWFDGKLVDWDKANVHILTHTLHYGLGVFEGIRCYRCSDGSSAVFRLKEHVDRLYESAKIVLIDIPFKNEDVFQAILETLRVNGLKEGYIRPIVFVGDGDMGVYVKENPIRVAIATWPWGAYLGEEGLKKGIRIKISSFTRYQVNTGMTKAKICGLYVNSILAKKEVIKAGYDEALLLDPEGYISEASGENIFIAKGGCLKTTPLTSILPGVTRNTIIKIAEDEGIKLTEQRFTRDELYSADEVFLCGTAAEITPVREVDDRVIGEGKPGPITSKLQEIFFRVVKGEEKKYKDWLAYL